MKSILIPPTPQPLHEHTPPPPSNTFPILSHRVDRERCYIGVFFASNPRWPSAALTKKSDQIVSKLVSKGESVAVAETSSGGLISASLLASEYATKVSKGSGVRLPVGISTVASKKASQAVEDYLAVHWGGREILRLSPVVLAGR